MKDTKKILRIAVFNALDGNITYSGNPVPVVDEKVRNSVPADLFILLGSQFESAIDRNSSAFITQSSIDLYITQKVSAEVSKDAIDEVYEDMLEIIFPTVGTLGIASASGFQFQEGFRESCNTQLVAITDTQSVLVSNVRLTFIITEQ